MPSFLRLLFGPARAKKREKKREEGCKKKLANLQGVHLPDVLLAHCLSEFGAVMLACIYRRAVVCMFPAPVFHRYVYHI